MENAALLESCRCLATEATKHFSDARAYSSVLTNSAGAQTVNILITTIYVDALCFETSVCVATERNELPYQNAASRSAQRNQTVPVSTNVPPPQPTPLLHTRWAKFYMSHYDFRITTFTSAMRTQTTHTSCASFFLFLQPTQLLQTYFKPINTQPLHQIDVNPLWPGGLFAFFFFFFGRERVWSAATFSARFWPLWIFNLYGSALNTSQGTALIFHLALTWPPIHLCWCWKNRLFLETAASFQTATPSCWHKRPTGVSPPAHHYSQVQIIYRLPPVTQ